MMRNDRNWVQKATYRVWKGVSERFCLTGKARAVADSVCLH